MVSVLLCEDKSEQIDAKDLALKISKIKNMLVATERRIEAHSRRLDNLYLSEEAEKTKEFVFCSSKNIAEQL